MAVSVKSLARKLNLSPQSLFTLLDAAGVSGKSLEDEITQDEMRHIFRLVHPESGEAKVNPKGSKQKFETRGRSGSKRVISVEIKNDHVPAPRSLTRSVIEKIRKPIMPPEVPQKEVAKEVEPAPEEAIPEPIQPKTEEVAQVTEKTEAVILPADEPKPESKSKVIAPEQADVGDEAKPAIKPSVKADVERKDKKEEADSDSKKQETKSKPKLERPKRKPTKGNEVPRKRLRLPKRVLRIEREQELRKKYGEKRKKQHQFVAPQEPRTLEVEISESNLLTDLAKAMSVKSNTLIQKLFELGEAVTVNDRIDKDTAIFLVEELGHKPREVDVQNIESNLTSRDDDDREQLPRTPVVVVMGHVDHGKTTLLDAIRSTHVVKSEKGGITQHIGAYMVKTQLGKITFLDTPGHEAFAAMRVRGSKVTDIVVLVVAADDGVMPQTIESIKHAKNADVPIIVAINKIDSRLANPNRVLRQLTEHGILTENLGGDVQVVEISALKKTGIDDLLEAIQLQSEILELTAPVTGPASGVVIEARVDVGRGVVATVLVQKGTLKRSDDIVAGSKIGKVRALKNDVGKTVRRGGPSVPLEIQGLKEVPDVGDQFLVVPNKNSAKELAEYRLGVKQSAKQSRQKIGDIFNFDEPMTLNILVKSDVQGSVEAITNAIRNLSSEKIELKVIHEMVGGISQSDVNLAITTEAIIIAFNVRADTKARQMIEEYKLTVIYSGVIYDALGALQEVIAGRVEPEYEEKVIARAKVLEVFRLSKGRTVAGCFVTDGTVQSSASVRVLTNNIVMHNGVIDSLRRYRSDVAEVKAGMECGISIRNYHDVDVNDELEIFQSRLVS